MSQTFIENATLLVITAILTGILVPIIKGIVDNRTFERQKRYEADLNRQSRIIEAQSQLLDELSQELWSFRYLAMAVSFYGMEDEDKKYSDAIVKYDDEAWGILNRLRVSMSKSRRLISENAYQELVRFYQWLTLDFDPEVRSVIKAEDGHGELNTFIYSKVTGRIDGTLHLMAREFHLVSDNQQIGGRILPLER